jgi:hypothetical protein
MGDAEGGAQGEKDGGWAEGAHAHDRFTRFHACARTCSPVHAEAARAARLHCLPGHSLQGRDSPGGTTPALPSDTDACCMTALCTAHSPRPSPVKLQSTLPAQTMSRAEASSTGAPRQGMCPELCACPRPPLPAACCRAPRSPLRSISCRLTVLCHSYFYQITMGCGTVHCTNRNCFSSPDGPRLDPTSAALLAVKLAQSTTHFLCAGESFRDCKGGRGAQLAKLMRVCARCGGLRPRAWCRHKE